MHCNFILISDIHLNHLQGAKKVKAQGMGVHKPEEIIEFGQNDLKVLSDMLADKPFFFGDEPTIVSTKRHGDGCMYHFLEDGLLIVASVLQLDIVAFASLAQVYFIDKEVQYSLRDYMQESCPNLVGHVNRMKERYVTHTSCLVIPCLVFI